MAVDAEPELYQDLGVHEDESGDEDFDEELEQVIQQEHSKFLQQQAEYYEQLQANRSWKVVPLASPGPAIQLQREEEKQQYVQSRQASGSITEEPSGRVEYVPPSRPADLPPSLAHLLPPDPSRPRSALPEPADAEDELYGLVEPEGSAGNRQHADQEHAAAEAAPAGDAEAMLAVEQQQQQAAAEEESDAHEQQVEQADSDRKQSMQQLHQVEQIDCGQLAGDGSSLDAAGEVAEAGYQHHAAAEAAYAAAEHEAAMELLPELPAEASHASPSPAPDPHSVSGQFSHWASEPSGPDWPGTTADAGAAEAEGECVEQPPAASSSNSAGAAAVEGEAQHARGTGIGSKPWEQRGDEQLQAEGGAPAEQQQQQVKKKVEPEHQQITSQHEAEVPEEDAAEGVLHPQQPGKDAQGSSSSSSSGVAALDTASEGPRSWPLARVTISAEASAATAASLPAEEEASAEDTAVAAAAAVGDAQPADLQEDLGGTAAAPAGCGTAKHPQDGPAGDRPPSRLSAAGSTQHLGVHGGSTSSIPGWSRASAGGHLSSREGSSGHVPLYADTSAAVAGALGTLLEDFSTAPSRMSVTEGAGPGARGSTRHSAAGRLSSSREASSSHVPHALHADTSAAVAGALDTLLEDFSTGASQVSVVGGSSALPAAARHSSTSRMSKEPSTASAAEHRLPSNASKGASTNLLEDSSSHQAPSRPSAAGRRASAEASMPRMPGHVPSDTSVAVAGALSDLLQDYSTGSAAPAAIHATSSTTSAAAGAAGSGLAACEEEQEEVEEQHAAADSEVSAASHAQQEEEAVAAEQAAVEAVEGSKEPAAAAHEEQQEHDTSGVDKQLPCHDVHAEAAAEAATEHSELVEAGLGANAEASTPSSSHLAAAGEHSVGLEHSGHQHSFATRSCRSQASRSGGPCVAPHTAYNVYERPQTAIAGPRGGRRPVSAYAGGRAGGSAAAPAAAVYGSSQGGSSSVGGDCGTWEAPGRQHRSPMAQAGGQVAAGRPVGSTGIQRPLSAGSNRPKTAPAAASYLRGGAGGLYGHSDWDNYQKPIYGWFTYHPLDSVHRPATAASCTATYSSRPASPPVAPLSVTQGPGVSARGLRTYMSDILLKLKQANRYCQILGAPWRYSLEAPNTAVLRNQMRVIMWPYGDAPGSEGSAGSSQQGCDIWSADMEEQQSSSSCHPQQQQQERASDEAEEEVYTPDEASACSGEAAAGGERPTGAGHPPQGGGSPGVGVAGKRPGSPVRRLTLSLTLFYQRHEQLQAQVQHVQQMQQRAAQAAAEAAAQQDAVLLQQMMYSQQQQQRQQQQHSMKQQVGPWEGSYDSKLQEASQLSDGHSEDLQIKAFRPQTALN